MWATGSGQEALDGLVAPGAPSSGFAPRAFAEDLFLADLGRRCLPIRAEGHTYLPDAARLLEILGHPPSSPRTVAHRRDVLEDLAGDDALRSAAETFYARVRDLRDRLAAEGAMDRGTERLRKLDALAALRDAVFALRGLASARSVLRRLSEAGAAAEASPELARLVELLRWESGASHVQVEIQLGADGTIRALRPLARRDLPSPASESAWGRFWRRLGRALRGERWDDEELLSRLLDEVFTPLADVTNLVLRAGLELEPFLGSLGMRDRARASGLEACLPAIGGSGGARFAGLWNPFLLAEATASRAAVPVACDLTFEGEGSPLVVVTGPNSGGKTRLLQSVALAVLLGQGGFFVPAREASWAWVPSLFASIAVAPEHDAPEGRLGTELLRVRHVFEHARPGCLVVLDELCAGTNPSEAEELVRFVLEQLADLGAFVIVTTHLLDVARHMKESPPAPRLAFVAVELTADERPTFRFGPGVADSSLARRTAERLGVTREALAEMVAARRDDPEAALPEVPDRLSRGDADEARDPLV